MQALFKGPDRLSPQRGHRRSAAALVRGAVESTGSVSQSLAPSSTASDAGPRSPPVRWKGGAAWALVGAGVAAATGAVIYMEHGIQREMAARTELLREYHEEQALRPPPAEVPEPTGALEVTSRPEGAAIWINGTQRPEVTPATISKLSFDHEAPRQDREGRVSRLFRTTTRLTDESPFKELGGDLKPVPATVVVHVEPAAGAAVWLDGKPWKGDHWVLDGVAPGVEHWLIIAAPGYVARMASVTPAPGETRNVVVKLVRAGALVAGRATGHGLGDVAAP